MNNFIPLVNSDRLREINKYSRRGYVFRDGKDKFNYVRNVFVRNKKVDEGGSDGACYFFEVRNKQEPRFYITVTENELKESCIYLTMYEIYELLVEIAKKTSLETVTKMLTSKRDKVWYMYYTALEFELKYFSETIPSDMLQIPDSNVKIRYENFFLLIAMIQEKSNYYWSNSTEENNRLYTNGIIRLLVCLINTKGNYLLEKHKWKYNVIKDKYEMIPNAKKEDYKYYLTRDEYKTIMEVRNPSILR